MRTFKNMGVALLTFIVLILLIQWALATFLPDASFAVPFIGGLVAGSISQLLFMQLEDDDAD